MRHWWIGFLLLAAALLLPACGGPAEPEATPEPTLSPEVALGKQLFQAHCAACHVTEGEAVIVGPSLDGVAGRAETRTAGLDARQYLSLSIVQPDAHLVEGFENLMPSTLGKQLTGEELDALVAYLLTLD